MQPSLENHAQVCTNITAREARIKTPHEPRRPPSATPKWALENNERRTRGQAGAENELTTREKRQPGKFGDGRSRYTEHNFFLFLATFKGGKERGERARVRGFVLQC